MPIRHKLFLFINFKEIKMEAEIKVETVRLNNTRHGLGFLPCRNTTYWICLFFLPGLVFLSGNIFQESAKWYNYASLMATFLISSAVLSFELLRYLSKGDIYVAFFVGDKDKYGKTREDKVHEFWKKVKDYEDIIVVVLDTKKSQPYQSDIWNDDKTEVEKALSLIYGDMTLYHVDKNGTETCLEGLPGYYKRVSFQEK
jgi:hypothetical protein